MHGKYKSYFVIPTEASRVLKDYGWEFHSTKRIPRELVDSILLSLRMEKISVESDMERFSGKDADATVFFDKTGEVEQIYLRAYRERDVGKELQELLVGNLSGLEIFNPRTVI
ncbi:MAG: hypothetical protein JNN30_19130 [Rhodanobacteraceae bacterium]|nr:hypothetical protein [Rhodanobacteraceae bacterium]